MWDGWVIQWMYLKILPTKNYDLTWPNFSLWPRYNVLNAFIFFCLFFFLWCTIISYGKCWCSPLLTCNNHCCFSSWWSSVMLKTRVCCILFRNHSLEISLLFSRIWALENEIGVPSSLVIHYTICRCRTNGFCTSKGFWVDCGVMSYYCFISQSCYPYCLWAKNIWELLLGNRFSFLYSESMERVSKECKQTWPLIRQGIL